MVRPAFQFSSEFMTPIDDAQETFWMNLSDYSHLAATKSLNIFRRVFVGCKFTPRLAQTVALARKEAATLKHDCVHQTHLVVALGHLEEGMPAERLKYLGFQYEQALNQARVIVGPGGDTSMESTIIPFSDDVKQTIASAKRRSFYQGLAYVGTDHLFLTLLERSEPLLSELIRAKGLDRHQFLAELEAMFSKEQNMALLQS